ncbi:MAG: apolipoprotein N-acyltransferase [Colwellia sp.]|nr:apolipoprotein N-acyltransferase [Colwellia sp.]
MIFLKAAIKTIVANNPSKKRQQRDFFLLLLTVILFYLAFPSGGYGNLAWLVMIPILIALNNINSSRYAFMLGLLAATLGWMLSIWWVVGGLAKVTFSQNNIVIPFVFLFCLISALPYAVAALLQAKFNWGMNILGTLKSAAIFTLLINFIPHLLPGNLAHSLYQSPAQIQLLSFGGVPLLFFIVHWVNALLACAIYHWRSNQQTTIHCLSLALFIGLANFTYGKLVTSANFALSSSQPSITIAMVQPNFDITLRTREDWLTQAPLLMQLISQVSHQEEVDLIVLPELPPPISYHGFFKDRSLFNEVINNKSVLITSISFDGKNLNESQNYFNAIELIQHQQLTGQYQKQVLVPFGEYLPFENKYPLLRQLFPDAPNYQAGTKPALISFDNQKQTINLVPLICYEAVFSELVREGVDLGGELFVNTVNDAWFGDTAGRDVHLALALYRTVEFRKPLVRVTNNGISSIFNAQGEIIPDSTIASFSAGVSITKVFIPQTKSFYQNYPNFFMILFLMLSGYAIMSGRALSYGK